LNFTDAYHRADKIYGYMTPQDCEVLNKYASRVSGIIVEIGALFGRSSKMLCLSSPDSQIYSYDIFAPRTDIEKESKQDLLENMKANKNWHFKELDSVRAGMEWDKDKPIDLLVVDGDHKRESVEKDIVAWVPKVKHGSWVLFHDYYHYMEGEFVIPAVDKFAYLFSEMTDYTDTEDIQSMFRICKKA